MDGWHGDGSAGGTTALWELLTVHPRILPARGLMQYVPGPGGNRTRQWLVHDIKEATFFYNELLYHQACCARIRWTAQ